MSKNVNNDVSKDPPIDTAIGTKHSCTHAPDLPCIRKHFALFLLVPISFFLQTDTSDQGSEFSNLRYGYSWQKCLNKGINKQTISLFVIILLSDAIREELGLG